MNFWNVRLLLSCNLWNDLVLCCTIEKRTDPFSQNNLAVFQIKETTGATEISVCTCMYLTTDNLPLSLREVYTQYRALLRVKSLKLLSEIA